MAVTRASRRTTALVAALVFLCAALTACGPDFSGVKLRIAAGSPGGVYFALAAPLASAWAAQLGIAQPQVQTTYGSPDNVTRLLNGSADVGFSAADVAGAHPQLRALARIYDDYLHVVVRANSNILTLDDLSGMRVAIGSPDSGVEVIAKQLLDLRHLSVTRTNLSLNDSQAALEKGDIDAYFWSGGLPTDKIAEQNKRIGLRLIDLTDVMPPMRAKNPVYRAATIPPSTYNLPKPVTTLVVSNFLVVPATMRDDVAEALVSGLFKAQPDLVKVNRSALSIDVHAAIETSPLQLHPGALKYYQSIKA